MLIDTPNLKAQMTTFQQTGQAGGYCQVGSQICALCFEGQQSGNNIFDCQTPETKAAHEVTRLL